MKFLLQETKTAVKIYEDSEPAVLLCSKIKTEDRVVFSQVDGTVDCSMKMCEFIVLALQWLKNHTAESVAKEIGNCRYARCDQ